MENSRAGKCMKNTQMNNVDLDTLLKNLNNEARYLEQKDKDKELYD